MSDIPARTLEHFDAAVAQKHIHVYSSSSRSSVQTGDGESTFPHLLHICPDFASKPAVPDELPNLTANPARLNRRDPIAGPIFGKDDRERAVDLGDNYAIVHNLHALMSEHELIVPIFPTEQDFRPQTSDLLATDLDKAWQVVRSYAQHGRDVVVFFNGGPLAGASQAHLHMQYCPFQAGPPGPEAVARAQPTPLSTDSPTLLPLPWACFTIALPSTLDNVTGASLHAQSTKLLEASRSYLTSKVPETELAPAGEQRDSYNLLLTTRHMHLVPRRERLVEVTRNHSKRTTASSSPPCPTFRLSVNGLLILGYWFVGSDEERQDLIEHGLERTLVECGYRRR